MKKALVVLKRMNEILRDKSLYEAMEDGEFMKLRFRLHGMGYRNVCDDLRWRGGKIYARFRLGEKRPSS